MDKAAIQRDYYTRTALDYEAMHGGDIEQHAMAVGIFRAMIEAEPPESLLEVGSGTGVVLQRMQGWWPDARIAGIEPVAALREIGHARGIAQDALIDGDVQQLAFADDSFDFVIETAVLHHVPDPRRAVAEMVRVARRGVMLSDSNRYGQGSLPARVAKDALRRLGLWGALIYLQTGGKMHKWSEGDGLYYSYSLFDEIPGLRAKFPRLFMMNTDAVAGTDLRFGCGQAMLVALR